MKKIKKILTAIGNQILNDKLREIKELAVIGNDVQYKEGILEILEINNDINYIILSELIPGEIKINELIEKIKNINNEIKIIIILDKDENKKNEKINLNQIYKHYYNNEVKYNELVDLINENEKMEKYNYEIKKEINELKEIIKNSQNNIYLNKKNKIINYNDFIKKIKNNYLIFLNNKIKNIKLNINNNKLKYINKKYYDNNIIKSENKIISILGNNGSGKSMFTVMLADILKENNKKILILDFDFLNNSLHTILGVKKYSEKIKEIINNSNNNAEKIEIEKLIIKLNNKIDLISGANILFNSKNKNTEYEFKKILINIFSCYEYIIIDTSYECFFNYTKEIIKMSNICFFLTEANLTEISKSKRLLEIYSNNWKIDNNKIKIIFNKYNNNCIDINLLKKLYFDYEIIGKIKLKNNIDNYNKNKLLDCKDKILYLLDNKKIKINN